ncbi:MAG: FecR family protein [Prochlorococcaceae cyanobacterium]
MLSLRRAVAPLFAGSLFAGSLVCVTLALTAGAGASPLVRPPKVVDVPTRPAFVKLPGRVEVPARPGQGLQGQTVLRTATPGRLQVQLADGRSFRLGGDALLRLAGNTLELQRGQIIAWVNPGSKGGTPLRVKTRVATASIVGTTVFIEATETEVRVFSWEGAVQVSTDAGQQVTLNSGELLSYVASPTTAGEQPGWQAPRRLSRAELDSRRARSTLLHGFTAPMETLPVIEKELGFRS